MRTIGQWIGCLGALTGVALAVFALYMASFPHGSRDIVLTFLNAALIVGVSGLVLFAVSRWALRR